ncbi:MAG: TonB family protein [Nevskia sp.]|nr:TonB family protein [Nevskia sp.]
MGVHAIRWESWALSEEADRRFRRIVLLVAVPALILTILVSIYKIEAKKSAAGVYNGSRYVELIAQQPAEAAPKPEEPKPAAKKAEEKPPQQAAPPRPVQHPTPVPTETAREAAQKTQEMRVIQDQLADLRSQNLNTITSQQPLVSGVISSKGGVGGSAASAETIASSAAANSGNGVVGSASVTTTQSGVGLGTRRTSTVQSPVGFGRDASRAGAGNDKVNNARTLTEIQEVFDRNKAALISIYNRQARESPNMGDGKIVVKFTIAPDGSITACSIVSSSFNDPDFERKIIERIKLFHFASKNVPPFSYGSYPIEFHPT